VTNKNKNAFASDDPSEICRALVGLKDVRILQYRRSSIVAELMIEQVVDVVHCPACGAVAHIKDRPVVTYVDLPVFGAPFRLVWRKHRMRCPNSSCDTKSWLIGDHRIAAKDCFLTTRAAKWATRQVGGGRTVNEVAKELHCGWDVIDNAVMTYGKALLDADTKRLKKTEALGLDETLFYKLGDYKHKQWVTTVADVGNHQLIDILPSRNYVDVAQWIKDRPPVWKQQLIYGALDMSASYAAVFSVTLPHVKQVVDPFHCVQLANRNLDNVRRRVQNEQEGHRGRKKDPLYRVRKLLLMGLNKLDKAARERLDSLMALGDPGAEVALAHQAKEALRDFYAMTDVDEAEKKLRLLQEQCAGKSMPKELQSFATTLKKWFTKIRLFRDLWGESVQTDELALTPDAHKGTSLFGCETKQNTCLCASRT
jgi:transposase